MKLRLSKTLVTCLFFASTAIFLLPGRLPAQTRLSNSFSFENVKYSYTLTYNPGLAQGTFDFDISAVPDSVTDESEKKKVRRDIHYLVRIQQTGVERRTQREDLWSQFLQRNNMPKKFSGNEIYILNGKILAGYQVTLNRLLETYFSKKLCPRRDRKKSDLTISMDEALFNAAEMFIKGSGCLFAD